MGRSEYEEPHGRKEPKQKNNQKDVPRVQPLSVLRGSGSAEIVINRQRKEVQEWGYQTSGSKTFQYQRETGAGTRYIENIREIGIADQTHNNQDGAKNVGGRQAAGESKSGGQRCPNHPNSQEYSEVDQTCDEAEENDDGSRDSVCVPFETELLDFTLVGTFTIHTVEKIDRE